jgi:hypothetical protein
MVSYSFDKHCPICRRKTTGGLFCSMSHYRKYLHAPKKFSKRKAIKEELETEAQTSLTNEEYPFVQKFPAGQSFPGQEDEATYNCPDNQDNETIIGFIRKKLCA